MLRKVKQDMLFEIAHDSWSWEMSRDMVFDYALCLLLVVEVHLIYGGCWCLQLWWQWSKVVSPWIMNDSTQLLVSGLSACLLSHLLWAGFWIIYCFCQWFNVETSFSLSVVSGLLCLMCGLLFACLIFAALLCVVRFLLFLSTTCAQFLASFFNNILFLFIKIKWERSKDSGDFMPPMVLLGIFLDRWLCDGY